MGHNVSFSAGAPGRQGKAVAVLAWFLASAAVVAFLLLVHNFALNLLPYQRRLLSPDQIQPEATASSFAYAFAIDAGESDLPRHMRSRVRFFEDDRRYKLRTASRAEVRLVGGGRFAHEPGRIVFAATDNSDPRTNGRAYALEWPRLYSKGLGEASAVALLVTLALLAWLRRARVVPSANPGQRCRAVRWHRWLAGVVFAAGLWINTGTLAPYAITFASVHFDPATGFAYNQDHPHFRVMFDFVDGKPRPVWDGAIMLRRILYPVMAWPFMKALGFELGGLCLNLLLAFGVFVVFTHWLARRFGGRAAVLGAWLLATYPGFSYWVAMPYQYAAIAPGALILTLALWEIDAAQAGKRGLVVWSAIMGVIYLAYDFAPIFMPATLGLLLWRRRWCSALVATVISAIPMAVWLTVLRFGIEQGLENSNAGIYRAVAGGLLTTTLWSQWLGALPGLGSVAMTAFFASNFAFLPMLFIGAVCLSWCSAGVRVSAVERSVLAATALLFLAINLTPDYSGGWNLSGTWASRIYQPMFAVMVVFLARWWQNLPERPRIGRVLASGLFVLALAGNVLVIAGPLLRDPLGVSGAAYFGFYSHAEGMRTTTYEDNLHRLPRRILGWSNRTGEQAP